MSETKYTIDETKVVYADLTPEEGVVLNLKTKNYYQLNETSQIVWKALSVRKSKEEIVSSLASIYDVPLEQLQKDVDKIIQKFREEQLIETTHTPIPTFDVSSARQSKKEGHTT